MGKPQIGGRTERSASRLSSEMAVGSLWTFIPLVMKGGLHLTLHPGPEHVRAKLTRDLTRRAAPANTIKLHKFPEIIVTVGNLTRFHGDRCEMAIKSNWIDKANNGEIGNEIYAWKIPYFAIQYKQ